MPGIIDSSGNGYGSPGSTLPHDWTEGTGVFPANGIITVVAPPNGTRRKWLYVQNQDVTEVQIQIPAVDKLGNTVTAVIYLDAAAVAGTQGSHDERGGAWWITNGNIVIVGTPGNKVCVLEVLE